MVTEISCNFVRLPLEQLFDQLTTCETNLLIWRSLAESAKVFIFVTF